MRDKQQNAELTAKEEKAKLKAAMLAELLLLKDIKIVMGAAEGKRVIKWVLGLANIFDDVFSNSGRTAYDLGIQHIGKKLMTKLIDAGCDLKLTDLMPSLDDNKLNNLSNMINQLNIEEKQNVR